MDHMKSMNFFVWFRKYSERFFPILSSCQIFRAWSFEYRILIDCLDRSHLLHIFQRRFFARFEIFHFSSFSPFFVSCSPFPKLFLRSVSCLYCARSRNSRVFLSPFFSLVFSFSSPLSSSSFLSQPFSEHKSLICASFLFSKPLLSNFLFLFLIFSHLWELFQQKTIAMFYQ